MARGLKALQDMASRDSRVCERKSSSLSRQAQARSPHCRVTLRQDSGSEDACFAAKLEELWHLFLMRPGCPQFSTRATSMTLFGPATTAPLPGQLCRDVPALKTTEDLPPRQPPDGRPLPSSKSACEFRSLHSPAARSPDLEHSWPGRQVPWYISVIHEKDHSLVLLEAEVQRLSQLEAQVQKKDEELLELQGEKEMLKKHLKCLLRSKGQDTAQPPESRWKLPVKLSVTKSFVSEEEELGRWQQEERPAGGRASDADAGPREEPPRPEEAGGPAGEAGAAAAEERAAQLAEEAEGDGGAPGGPAAGAGPPECPDDAFEQELMAQLQEYEQAFRELQLQLEVARSRYSLAVGAITSLQRQVDFQEAQLQKAAMDNQMLEKELRERKLQLQAMSHKFSNLREDKKHEEMLGLVEKDNLLLQQQVLELELELRTRDHTISELEAKVGQLQEQADLQQNHLQRWKHLQEEMQNKHEMAQQAEQQASVALESFHSRLERLRSKIIQATFSTTGAKSMNSEISDSDILEALQTIITERSEYYNQLKQKGVKVPPLHQSEVISAPSKSKKPAPK
ncbi:coiled-coil domain-containing protein 27 [Talpa occidentalis]|uniref:coiled-coil domain-containing protein 27 n=1 Tax=Talpa occidentalis TaxID=50954 RepID=UPI0023F62D7F|nr:coiled-coil domain-containing protein 27 [Talpa occidentalis]